MTGVHHWALALHQLTRHATERRQGPQGQAHHPQTSPARHPRRRGARHPDPRHHRLRRRATPHQPRPPPQGRAEEEEQGCRGLEERHLGFTLSVDCSAARRLL